MKPKRILKHLRVDDPAHFHLAGCDCAATAGLDIEHDAAKAMLADDIERLSELQKRLYADGRWALLIVLQGMDAAGKDGVVSHVMSGVNPQGIAVHSFKAPNTEEVAHDFLWRVARHLPERGQIGIFNRSHYEEVLAVRVRPELLAAQKLPPSVCGRHMWKERCQDIRGFERHLARSGVVILKFFLHISRQEQARRLLARLDEPLKHWKFSLGDIADRALWDSYMEAYEDAIRWTSRPEAPWFVVPADHKWFARLVVARAVVDALERLDLEYPRLEGAALSELGEVRKALEAELPREKR